MKSLFVFCAVLIFMQNVRTLQILELQTKRIASNLHKNTQHLEKKECDCGEGQISCEFNKETGKKLCKCMDGYVFDEFSASQKCFNCRRSCEDSAVTCEILRNRIVRCSCKEGFATSSKDYKCHECDCGSHQKKCSFDYYQIKKCECESGYSADSGTCKVCDCGANARNCYFSTFHERVCICQEGYSVRFGICEKCDCGIGNSCTFSKDGFKICDCPYKQYFSINKTCEACDCQPDVDCEYKNNIKTCLCPNGFEDKNGRCEDINECLNPSACHSNSHCVNTNGSYDCFCDAGYRSKYGEKYIKSDGCVDIDECFESYQRCSNWNLECNNLPGTYECNCISGYEPENIFSNPEHNTCYYAQAGWKTATIITGVLLGLCTISFISYICHHRPSRSMC